MTAPLPLDTILHGNCIDLLEKLPAKSIDLIFADPPYNLQLQHELRRPNLSLVDAVVDAWDQFDDLAEYDAFTRAWLGACRRVLKDEGTLWVIGSYHNIFRVGSILMDLGYWILNDILWEKTNPMPNFRGTRFTNATETLIWAQKSREQKRYTFNYQAMKQFNDEKQMGNVWRIPLCTGAERIKIDGKKAHSTQKPEALLYRVLLASSNPGDVVLDPFFGSGTTGAVAKRLGRHYIGIEREAAYVQVAQARLAGFETTSEQPALLQTPSRRDAPRVRFAELLAVGYIQIGQVVYSANRQHQATIHADGSLVVDDFKASIHRMAARLLGKESHNGWDYWYVEDSAGNLLSIDHLREKFRQATSEESSEEDGG